jgi:hypothetical protein
MNFDFFLSGEFYQMQAQLAAEVAAPGRIDQLPAVRRSLRELGAFQALSASATALAVAMGVAMSSVVASVVAPDQYDNPNTPVFVTSDAEQYMDLFWPRDLTGAFEKLGMALNEVSPAERRQMRVSDWIYDSRLNDRLYDGRLWWLTYWPARAWEHVVLRLPTRWFRRRRPSGQEPQTLGEQMDEVHAAFVALWAVMKTEAVSDMERLLRRVPGVGRWFDG